MSARKQHAINRLDVAYTAPAAGIFRFPSPVNGQIVRVAMIADNEPVGGDAVFDVNLSGVSIWAADPTQRVKIADGDNLGEVTGLAVAVSKDEWVEVDFDNF